MTTRPTMAAVRELAGFKEPVRVATTANIDVAAGGLLTIDGVTLVAGERVLVKNQTDATENGIYLASAGEWYRAPDAMSSRNIGKGVLVWVASGTANEDNVYAFDTLSPDIGTDDIVLVLQDWSGGEGLEDAPADGNQYGREDNEWTIVTPVDYATVAETRAAATGDKVFTTDLIEAAAAFVALTDAETVAVDWDNAINFSLTLGGNRTLGNPTNGQPGTWRTFIITQDGTGSRTLAFGDQYHFEGGTTPTLSTAIGAVDVLSVLCVTASLFYAWSSLDVKA
jgi:hypothetical protein